MTRAILAGALVLFGAVAVAAPTKTPVEMWGLSAGDEVTIDGAAVPVRSGGPPRVFSGDPSATNAPVVVELAAGKHEVVVRRAGCAPRTFTLDVESATKRVITFEPQDEARCSIPLLPSRR